MSYLTLICDDSGFARKQLKRQLPAEFDWHILEAGDGVEALGVIDEHPIKLLFLDLTMPELDGYGVLEKLQSAPPKEDINVIVISGDIQPEAQKRVMELGALEFLKKPVDADTLKQCLVTHQLIEE